MKLKKIHILVILSIILIIFGFLIPERLVIPVQGAGQNDWNHNTFWYEPWGISGVHKGIDIFAPLSQPVITASPGIVLYKGKISLGGNIVLILGPKWRLHYYAHLHQIDRELGFFTPTATVIGQVGDSGNATGKPPHLHYSIISLLPCFWRWDASTQGWKKMFFLDPGELLLTDQIHSE